MAKKIDDLLSSRFEENNKKELRKTPDKKESTLFDQTISQSLLNKKEKKKPRRKDTQEEAKGKDKLKKEYEQTMIDFKNCNKKNMEDSFLSLLHAKELLHQDLIQRKKVYDYLSKKDGWADLQSYYKYLYDKCQNETISSKQFEFFRSVHGFLKFKKEVLSLNVKVMNNAQMKSRLLGDESIQEKVNILTEELKVFHRRHIFNDLEFFGTLEIKTDELLAKIKIHEKKESVDRTASHPKKNQVLKFYANHKHNNR